jgi:DNA-binding MarR family transcriptional regulator
MRPTSGATGLCTISVSRPPSTRVLAILSRRGGSLFSAALSRRLGVSPQSATEIVAMLSALGLVCRTQGAEQRRVRRLELTLGGRNLLVQCDAEVDRFEEARFGLLAAPERETLRGLLINQGYRGRAQRAGNGAVAAGRCTGETRRARAALVGSVERRQTCPQL